MPATSRLQPDAPLASPLQSASGFFGRQVSTHLPILRVNANWNAYELYARIFGDAERHVGANHRMHGDVLGDQRHCGR